MTKNHRAMEVVGQRGITTSERKSQEEESIAEQVIASSNVIKFMLVEGPHMKLYTRSHTIEKERKKERGTEVVADGHCFLGLGRLQTPIASKNWHQFTN